MPLYTYKTAHSAVAGQAGRVDQYQLLFDNSAALKQGDQALDQLRFQPVTSSTSGLRHNVALPAVCSQFNYYDVGASAEISGFAGGQLGRFLLVRVLGGGFLRLLHDNTGSAVGNRILTPSSNGQYLGPKGSALLWYEGSAWRCEPIYPGDPITPTFAAGDYTGVGQTWTVEAGDVQRCAFQQWGQQLDVALQIATTTVSGAGSGLQRVIPGGFTHGGPAGDAGFMFVDTGTSTFIVRAYLPGAGAATLQWFAVGASWPASTNTLSLRGVARFRVD